MDNLFGSLKNKFSRKQSNSAKSDADVDDERLSRRDVDDLSTGKNNPFLSPATAESQPQGAFLDAPPAYTRLPDPSENQRRRSASPSRASITSTEDKYAFLSTFDTIFVIDDSGSMAGRSWGEVRDALAAIAPICTSHDPNGIDIYFLNHKSDDRGSQYVAGGGYNNIKKDTQVLRLFEKVRPSAATPTGTCLNRILRPYMRSLEANKDNMEDIKPINIIVITDGMPTDDPESVILQHARKLERLDAPPHQVGIQFFQVGNEPSATEALRSLDDSLCKKPGQEGYVRDIVDTVAWKSLKSGGSTSLSADGILKVVLGAVIRKLDEKTLP